MIFHLQGDDAAELCRRIVDYVGEISIEGDEHGFDALAFQLREEIAQTVTSAREVEEEIRHMREVLNR